MYFPDFGNIGDDKEREKLSGLVTGQTLKNDMEEMTSATKSQFSGSAYQANKENFKLGNLDQMRSVQQKELDIARNRDLDQGKAQSIHLGKVSTADKTLIDQNPQAQFRQDQLSLSDSLRSYLSGKGQSAAEMQLQRGQEANLAAANALKAGSTDPSLARRQAMDSVTQSNLQTNQQAAQLRAEETQRAQGLLSNVSGQGRQQDIGLATQQADLTQNLNQFNATAINQQNLNQANLYQQTNLANQQNLQKNLQLQDQMIQGLMAQGLSQEQAQLQANMELERINAQQRTNINALNQSTAEANAERDTKAKGGVLNAAGAIVGMISDKREKKDITSGDEKAQEMLNALKAYNYKYKNQSNGKGEQLGLMAQDLEKNPITAQAVDTDRKGRKIVDTSKLVLPTLASVVNLNKRLQDLENIEEKKNPLNLTEEQLRKLTAAERPIDVPRKPAPLTEREKRLLAILDLEDR